jgi:hypothetical protein
VHDDSAVFEALDVIGDVLSDGIDGAAVPGEVERTGQPGNGGNGNGNGGAKAVGSVNGVAPTGNGTKPHGSNGAATNGNGAAKDAENGTGTRKTNGAPTGARTHRDAAQAGTVVIRPSSAPAEVVAAAADLIARRPTGEVAEGLALERIDVERRAGTLRCRTVLALGERRYSAIAEVPDSPSAEAELAARVAVDALRAGGLTTAMLDGVGFITIAKTNYCVATVREPGNATPRAGAAPLIDSMAASATAAVLTALGSFTDARAQSRARAGH